MRKTAILFLGVLFLLAGCARKTAVSPGSILFLGDSLTAGYGLDPAQAYPALVKIPGMTAQNFGVSGNTTDDGLQRLRNFFKSDEKPQLVVVALGANDILHGVDAGTTGKNLDAIILECRNRDIPVLLCGVKIPFKFGTDAIFEDAAHRNHVPLMPDLLQGEAFHADLMQEDHMHPTAEGQQLIADKMQVALLESFSFGR